MEREYNYEEIFKELRINVEKKYTNAEDFARNIKKCDITQKINVCYNNLTNLKKS